ncbi:MAG: type II CRISPR RNA-guided endonuclease Cas9 [Syntrophaceae bacterium]|nr:type II CRISPR RNA-guided endonuclease Cas9 [Syntrophaceae bacterium]
MMHKRVLGLDLGPNSIGWALVDDDPENPENSQLVDMGVRVFPEGVDAFDTSKEVSRNEKRRIARGMRRQVLRRVRRRRYLRIALIEAKLWPDDPVSEAILYGLDPYELRARALVEKLSPYEIGRIFLHLCQRRGFLSNRKKDRGNAEVKGMLAEINENEQERENGGFETIGAWLAHKKAKQDHLHRIENDHIRHRHLARQQYEEEFEAIWSIQSNHHPELLTEILKYGHSGKQTYPRKPQRRKKDETPLIAFGLHGLIFYQRPMYWPKSVVGLCELESKQKRCQRSDRRYQRFRLLQEVNNLRYIDPDTYKEEKLTDEQRQLLLDKLNRTKEMTFDQIRNALGFLESVKFNLEGGKRTKLQGVPVDALLANKNVIGAQWYNRSEEQKTEIIAVLLDNERDDDAIIKCAVEKWGMTPEQAEAMLEVDLKPGYGNLSLMALDKLLPHMERGLLYMATDESNSALHAAGYLRRDQLQRRIFDKLPDPARTSDCPIGDIPNPVVKRTLTEVRRVVNSIIREYGKPAAVHIEMAREVKQGRQARSEYSKRIREREAERESAENILRENGVSVNSPNILKYLLWLQQGQDCIYSGESISFAKLFGEGGGVEVDHILPRSRTLDDSQMNKVICLRTANADKGDQTPHEWLADKDPARCEQICQRAGKLMRAGKMPYAKYRRFIQKELELDNFIARQLTDTSYITRVTAEYLRCLFQQDHDVLGLKGQLTSELRWHWGLETILQELPDSPGWQDEKSGKLRPGEKNRADHRHHAIDAVVLALTNRSRLQILSRIFKSGGARKHGEILFDPWPGFRDVVIHRIKTVNVSHRVERKVRGALHDETLYGSTLKEGEWVFRKPLVDLSSTEIERIRDDTIRELVMNTLRTHGIAFGRSKKIDNKKMKELLSNLTMSSGVPIRRVRIIKTESTIRRLRKEESINQAYVKPGSLHHLCIFEWEENGRTKRDAVFVTMMEAMERLKYRQPLIQRTYSHKPDARFVMSLSIGEMIMGEVNGGERLLKLRTSVSTEKKMTFQLSEDARRDYRKIIANTNTLFSKLHARKVTVDPLGRIHWAND